MRAEGAAGVKLLGYLFLAGVVLVVSFMLLWSWFEPSLRERLEREASQSLGSDVEIGGLRPRSLGLTFQDVAIEELTPGVELHVERMNVSPTLSSLLRQGEVVVEEARLERIDAFLSRRHFGPPELWSRFMPEIRRNLSARGVPLEALRRTGVSLAPDGVIHLAELRLWVVDENGDRTLVHEEPEATLARSRDKLVLMEKR